MPNDMLEELIVLHTPPEILMKIFSEFYEKTAYTFKVGDKTDMAFVISHVCRQWRNTAIHLCTGFWSTLAIVSSPGSIRGRTKAWAELTSMAIHRSKNKELDVTFMGSDEESTAPSLAEALCVIMAHSRRLKVLNLHLPSTFVPLLSILVGRVPNLRRCAVCAIGNDISTLHVINAFTLAPVLEQLTFTGFDSRSTFSVPHTSITFYEDIHNCYASENAHNLTLHHLQASLHIWYFRAVYQRPWMGQFHAQARTINCPNIRMFAASQGALFRSVTLPFIRSIVVESNPLHSILDFTDGDCLGDVHDLIVRSQCYATLTHIAIYNTLLTEDIFNILSELPLLIDLAFHYDRWYKECDSILHVVVKVLSSISEDDTLGLRYVNPALTRFTVMASCPSDHGPGSIEFVSSHLADMIERCHHPLSEPLGMLSVTVQANSPLLKFSHMTDEVIVCLTNCHLMGHDIRVAGFMDGVYMKNIIPNNLAAVELDVAQVM